MALLHAIVDTLGTYNHHDVAAAISKPFVSDEVHWICEKHGAVQGYFYVHHLGMDRNVREQYRGHPYYEACAHFCERYDQAAFDPAYDSAPLSFFEPMVRRVMERPINSLYRSEEHTSELQSLMRISYAVFCLKKKKTNILTLIQSIHI